MLNREFIFISVHLKKWKFKLYSIKVRKDLKEAELEEIQIYIKLFFKFNWNIKMDK